MTKAKVDKPTADREGHSFKPLIAVQAQEAASNIPMLITAKCEKSGGRKLREKVWVTKGG